MSGIPSRFQLVVNVHDGAYHLFEMDYDDLPFVLPGMFLVNVPGVPNVVGPAAEFDNKILRVSYDGKIKRMLLQIGGMRCATQTIEEVREELPEWVYVRELDNVQDVGPQDML